MSQPLRISSVIIAKNEEANIARCIESQLSCVDDILILVDDSTTDNTVNIVRSFPQVRCELVQWKGYAQTKQYGVDKALHDWILWIDADEALRRELQEELQLFKTSTPQHSAYSIARRAYFLGKWIRHSGWYPGRVLRLFHRAAWRMNQVHVHEGLIPVGNNSNIGVLKNDIDHYTDPDIHHYYEKFNHYTTLAAQGLMQQQREAKLIDLLLRPSFTFLKMYVLRLGFLDGKHGFILAVFSAHYVFTKYAKLWEQQLSHKK